MKKAISKEILERLKAVYSFNDDKEIAQLFGISPQSFVNKRKTGTLLPDIINAGINKNVILNWLLTGEGNTYIYKGGHLDSSGGEVELEDPALFLNHRGKPVKKHRQDLGVRSETITREDAERRKQAESDESHIGIGHVVDQIVSIMNTKDPVLRRAVLANLDALITLSAKDTQINRMEKQLNGMQKEMTTFHSILDDIREILKKNQPPEGIKERRKSWIEMKKTFGLD